MNKKLILKIENAILLILVAISLFVISLSKGNFVNAAENIITVYKNSAISVYVTGIGVELKNSTSFVDEYTYEVGTDFTINSVNETRIFKNYVITDSSGTTNVTTRKYTNKKTGNFSINVEGTVPLSSDQGSYMGDRFLLEDDEDLIALQEIIKAGSTYNAYNYTNYLKGFFEKFLDTSSITSSNYSTYYNKIINGYYLVANNISVFSSVTINNRVYNFTGIGTTANPFNGVVCGDVSGVNSQIVSVININDLSNANLYSFGFFGNLSDDAIVRNIKFATSIGLKSSIRPGTDLFAGGVAGKAGSALLVNVEASANISVDIPTFDTNVYSGTIVGYADGLTIDSISNIKNVRDYSSLTVNTLGNNYAGGIAGYAKNMYIKELDIDFSGLSIILRNVDSKKNVYGGVLFGFLENDKKIVLEDIKVKTTDNFRVETYSDTYDGDVKDNVNVYGAFSGGIAGYFEAKAQALLGNISFVNTSKNPSVISSNTIDANSKSNCYSGGLFAYITDSSAGYVKGDDQFNYRITEKNIDGKKAYSYNPIFTGDFNISSVQNGLAQHISDTESYLNIKYGKCVSGGLVGRGLIGINGTSSSPSDIVISKEGTLNVSATQTRIARHENHTGTNPNNNYKLSDYEHCVSSMVFGLISNAYTDYDFENINIYGENINSTTEREIGSQANGHISNGGFIAFANGQDFENINLYLNSCAINSYSLSYEVHSKGTALTNTDNAHVGGVVGFFNNDKMNSNKSNTGTEAENNISHLMNNVSLQGINWEYKDTEVGTKLKIYSIQNTMAGSGDCTAENYVGGIVGKLYRNNMTNITYIGSETNEDYVRMSGHEDPDSAFCGGIVGFINGFRVTSDKKLKIQNCIIKNADVYGEATITDYNNPDIYIGGVIGALYSSSSNGMVYTFDNLSVIKSNVKALGNEHIRVYSGGVIAGICWSGETANITNCYISDSYVESIAKRNQSGTILEAYSAGIIAYNDGFNIKVNNNATIECLITSSHTVAGISSAKGGTRSYKNNYSNAILSGATTYGVAYGLGTDDEKNFYHSENAGTSNDSTSATDISFDKQLVNTQNDKVVDDINTSQEYMKYILEYGPENNSGYQTNGGATTVTTYTYRRTISQDEYDNLKFVYTGATYSGYYVYLVENRGTNNYYTSVTVDNKTYYIPTSRQTTNTNNNQLLIKTETSGRYTYRYYVQKSDTYAISIDQYNPINNKFNYTISGSNYVYEITAAEYNALSQADKELFEPFANTTIETVDNSISFIGTPVDNVFVDKLHLWVNFKGLGTTPGYEFDPDLSREELHALGWFDFGNIIVYNKDEGVISNPKEINNDKVTYIIDDAEYEYNSGNDSFNNLNYPFDTVSENGYEINTGNNFEVRVHDYIPSWKLTFYISNEVSLIEEIYDVDSNGNETIIDTSSGTVSTYGSYSLTYIIVSGNKKYTLTFTPNVEIRSDATIRIKFRLGNSETLDSKVYTLKLIKNEYILVGVKYADYTPALNDYNHPEVITNDIGTSYLKGQYRDITYKFPSGSIVKFIPIFRRENDLKVKLYEDERFLELVSFNSASGVKSSGELTISKDGTVEMSYNSTTVTFKYTSHTETPVTYSVVGMTPEAIPYAASNTDYEFVCYVNSGYSGHPSTISIKIGGTTYSYNKAEASNNLSTVLKSVIDSKGRNVDFQNNNWDMNEEYYKLIIDGTKIKDTMHITVEFPLVYSIRFDLQNSNISENELVYKVEDGQNFNTFFNGSRNNEIKEWVNENTIFGFAFTGFFLVSESNTHSSYGINYEDILSMNNFEIHTSFTFYARWSFLIELVEAPGTTITPSFKDTFMTEITDENLVNRTIKVPLNNKEGYVFTVEKDPTFIGEAEVQAYIITKVGDRQVVTEITIEKYHENMYLYHIPPEAITGYLMIVTSISNSGFIVGQNTATVTEQILPEDGIFTYKYVVNHKNETNDQSYLYDSGKEGDNKDANLSTYKNFVLYFYEQTYNTDKLATDKINYYLPAGTSIEVYYQKYTNTILAERIVASYEVTTDNTIHYISLDEFRTIDYQDSSPFKHETFRTFLNNNDAVSEVYYIIVTPPNGYRNIDKEIKNIIIEGGYENEYHYEAVLSLDDYAKVESALQSAGKPLTDLNKFRFNTETTRYIEITEAQYAALRAEYQELFEYSPFIKGVRNGKNFVNIPLVNEKEADFVKYESSVQTSIYSVTPSRVTTTTQNGTYYTFTDDKNYDVYYLEYENGGTMSLTDGKISISPTANYDSIVSSDLPFNLVSLSFTAGYNIGKIDVYGIKNGSEVLIKTVNIDSIEYKKYNVSFVETTTVRYDKFKLKVSASTGEIRISSLSVVSLTNGMTYSMDQFSSADIHNNKLYFEDEIVNDQRHDGKTFMIAVQLTDSSGNVVEIPNGLAIKVNGTTYTACVDEGYKGRVTAYFNMSEIIDKLGVTSFNYTIVNSGSYKCIVQLIEVTNPQKPAMSEVRGTIN